MCAMWQLSTEKNGRLSYRALTLMVTLWGTLFVVFTFCLKRHGAYE